jgi:hypothetical protein
MNTLLFIVFLVILGYTSQAFTSYLRQNSIYKKARVNEIRRRLQVEHKQEKALEELLKDPMDDKTRQKITATFATERHQRQIYYLIQDTLERWR